MESTRIARSASDYETADLRGALDALGLQQGDVVFVHVCLDGLGVLGASSGGTSAQLVLGTVLGVLGPTGTLLAPSYTFSFCRRETYDPDETPALAGPWSTSVDLLETLRHLPGASRSIDPIHAAAGVGPRAADLLGDLPPTCFGPGSLQARLVELDAKVCTIGVGMHEATLVHHAEEIGEVPFRYRKLFTGRVRERGRERKTAWIYSVRIPSERTVPAPELHRRACQAGLCRTARVGAGEIACVSARAYFEWLSEEIGRNPWSTARGPAADPLALEAVRVPVRRPQVLLGPDPAMRETLDALWRIPRDIVSDGYDTALSAIADRFGAKVHAYPTGTACWTWIVPEKWTCEDGWLETVGGRRVFSYRDNPLHVVSYSLPFDGWVSRDVLFEHLHTRPALPDAVPFEFKYYDRDWGLCCADAVKQTLHDDRYRVVIKSHFSYGTLKVGEIVVPGRTAETFVLCAHLCHPAMANDDLAGLVVGLEAMRRLRLRPAGRYTYRLLIVPETIGSVAFLSHHEPLIASMFGGLFLEMLGLQQPHAVQSTFEGDGYIDRCVQLAVHGRDPEAWTGRLREVVGNDERQFNAAGVRVPMASLSRVLKPGGPWMYYREYHTSLDTPERVSDAALEESCAVVLDLVDILETDRVVEARCKGEIFCSRFGLEIDWAGDRDGTARLFEALDRIDGGHTISEIARSTQLPYPRVRQLMSDLERHGLVALREPVVTRQRS